MTPTIVGPRQILAEQLHASKYRLPGESFRDAMSRVAGALQDNREHYHSSREILLGMRFLPAGRVQSAMGAPKSVTPYNCYVSGTIPDSFVDRENSENSSIMHRAEQAATTMRMGGGIGYDFSTLRPKGAKIRKIGSQSTGPISFAKIYNEIGAATSSAGERRGAQMLVLRIDHPDIEQFINAKHDNQTLTRFNISVGVTDQFMEHLAAGKPFPLSFEGEVYKYVDPEELWEMLMRSTYDWAEPGVLFIDRINDMNNMWYAEKIAATNPCIVGSTKIAVAGRGPVPIRQLFEEGVDVPVFAVDPKTGETHVRWGRNPRLTGNKKRILRVLLDDGSYLRVTENHKFPLRDGRKVQAKDLKPRDSLFRFDEVTHKSGEKMVGLGVNARKEYHLIAEAKYGRKFDFGNNADQFHTHHVDDDHYNNSWDNIEVKTSSDHMSHHRLGHRNPMRWWWDSQTEEEKAVYRAKMRAICSGDGNPMWGRFHSEETRSQIGAKTSARMVCDDARAAHGVLSRVGMTASGAGAKIRASRKKMFATVTKNCEHCREAFSFRAHPDNQKKIEAKRFCTKRCSLVHRNKAKAGKPLTEDHKRKLSESTIGRPHTAEHNAKVSAALLGIPKSDAHRAATSDGAKRRTDQTRDVEGKYINHKVVSVEFDGYEDVYNITVDEFHNYAVVTSEGSTSRGNRHRSGVMVANCGEQPLPPFGACLLGSYNLVQYVRRHTDGTFYLDYDQFGADIPVITRMMDNVVDRATYPLVEQEREAKSKRRMGMGVTGMANALEACGYAYGTGAFVEAEHKLLAFLTRATYLASADLASEKGTFDLFDQDRYCAGKFVATLDSDVQERIARDGLRNSHLISYAPTGTISMTADNVSSSIEPVYQWRTERPIEMPSGIVNVSNYDYGFQNFRTRGRRAANGEVTTDQHVDVLVAAQSHCDSAVSKTINCDETISWGDFKKIYTDAYDRGAKGATTFNKAGKRFGLFKQEVEPSDLPFPEQGLGQTPHGNQDPESCTFDPQTGRRTCE